MSRLPKFLHKVAVAISDVEAWASLNPARIVKRYANKWIYRKIQQATKPIYFSNRRRKKR